MATARTARTNATPSTPVAAPQPTPAPAPLPANWAYGQYLTLPGGGFTPAGTAHAPTPTPAGCGFTATLPAVGGYGGGVVAVGGPATLPVGPAAPRALPTPTPAGGAGRVATAPATTGQGQCKYVLHGYPVAAVLRWLGSLGVTPAAATRGLAANGLQAVSPCTVKTQLQHGRHNRGGYLPPLGGTANGTSLLQQCGYTLPQ